MAAEAAPVLSLEGQQNEEYIDYSEDESAAPAVVTEDSNHTSFSANAHFVADEVEYTEKSILEPDHQTIDLQVDAEIDAISVTADAPPQRGDLDSTAGLDIEGVHSVSALEAEDSYVNEDESLADAEVAEPEDGLIVENEISWEDGPVNEEDAAQEDSNQDENHIALDKDEWQLVEEREGIPQDGKSPAKSAGEYETEAHEIDQELADSSNDTKNVDTNPDAVDITNVDVDLDEQEAAEPQDAEVNDERKIDFHEGDSVATADGIVDTSDTQLERPSDYQETDDNFSTEQDAEHHTIGEDTESQPKREVESDMAATGADQINDEETQGGLIEAEDFDAVGEDLSVHEHVEFDDEVLDDARSSISVETPAQEELEIPDVTVSYKGIDYPFFYGSPDSQGKECFFNDLSLLHCKMEGVLAGFRQELANEIGPFDELVFQIDELGLEFAESSQAEVFSDITLGQIISVFDSLVKNQDADASKPLYAYLTTRPNCKKRWLSLVDDAYNGKGLDEISYYFASRAQSEAPEIMDDEPDLIGEEDNADAAAWPQSPADSGHGEHNYNEAHSEHADINEDDDVGDGITGEDDTQSQNATENASSQPDESAVPVPDTEATMFDTEASLMDESTAVADISTVEDADVEDATEDQQPQEHGEADADAQTQAPEINEPNPLAWETQEAVALSTTADAHDIFYDEDTAVIADQIVDGVTETSAEKVTPNTSATSTLNGDEEVTYENELDLNADLPENEDVGAEVVAQNEGLAEIDWREFSGQGDDEIAVESPLASGKRQRSDVDDLLDEEAQQDVKRRRS
ncbi:hypothetical protein CORC01_02024 [Colletotrichum orchidophilum]|uniref:Uncharacterized protein n=1 Tax=Colletotrichum orchidophilum TaxID=1209926 RepID=A0A1G4BMU5_9PEZI|nr:uncharacterized protein CORC01_02024 [Colletotrichum orchidophilum]OHF02628.1 hypothetical protein CORC01_02024 [Colletotrichum orchidophilum]